MKVIALRGNPNTGKTTTITTAYAILLHLGYTQVPGHFNNIGNPKDKDFRDILFDGKVKLSIVSMGDLTRGIHGVKQLIDSLQADGCDVVICVCRPQKLMQQHIRSFTPHHFVDKVVSASSSSYFTANYFDAMKLITFI